MSSKYVDGGELGEDGGMVDSVIAQLAVVDQLLYMWSRFKKMVTVEDHPHLSLV